MPRAGTLARRVLLTAPERAWAVAADGTGLWVAGRLDDADDVLLHYNARGDVLGQETLTDDITALTVGHGRVWAATSGSRVVSFTTQLTDRASYTLNDPATVADLRRRVRLGERAGRRRGVRA